MNKFDFYKMNKLIFVITSLLSALAGIIFGINLLTNYDNKLQFFNSKPIFAYALILIVIFSSICYSVFVRINTKKKLIVLSKNNSSIFNIVLSLAFSLAFAFDFIYTLYLNERVLTSKFILYVIAVSAALSAICYLLDAFKFNVSIIKEYTMIFPTLWAIFKMLMVYFDSAFALNAALKSLQILTFIVVTLFFILDARFYFKKQTIATFSFLSISSSLTIGFTILWTIALFKSTIMTHIQLSEVILLLLISIYEVYSLFFCSQKDYIPDKEICASTNSDNDNTNI